jgi:hypothetical protein
MKNQISTVLTEDVFGTIVNQIDEIDSSMPFLVSLPEEDRKGGFKLGDKNLGFLEKGRDYIARQPDFLPSYYSGEEVEKDATLTTQLSSIARKLRVLADKIEDTASIAGMEALSGVLAYYNTVKQAARNNINGAQTIYDDLSIRFPGRQKDNGEQ